VFSEQGMLAAVSNNISIASFNNNCANTANAPREINLFYFPCEYHQNCYSAPV
jgi:hypothetical protein